MIYPRVKEHVELDELIALANAGLAEAATRFDPTKGAQFSTFAWYRVQGSIIDGLRKSSNLPRRVWAKLVALRAASDYLEHRAEREAGALAKGTMPPEGGQALTQIKDELSAIRTMYVMSLEAMQESHNFDKADDSPRADETLDSSRAGKKLRQAIDALPEKEQKLMRMHYWEGKNLLEAGEQLGISKSWASRLHAQIVEKLRSVVDE